MARKKRPKPWPEPSHPEWGKLFKVQTGFEVDLWVRPGERRGDDEVVGSGEVLTLKVARFWRKDNHITVTYYKFNPNSRRFTEEKVWHQHE